MDAGYAHGEPACNRGRRKLLGNEPHLLAYFELEWEYLISQT